MTIWLAGVCPHLSADDGQTELATDRAIQQAAALVAPSVVRIDTIGGREQLEPGMVSSGATTGLIVSSDGYIVSSAFHFVSKPASIIVTLADGRRLAGRQIATDRQRMIALLKVEADRLQVPTAAPVESFRVGQWSIALGRTFAAETPSISVGIISAIDRVWGKALQTDAKISPVNYGGPLVDIQGRVMGVLAPLSPHESGETAGAEWYDSGIGFAVPLADILSVLDRLKSGDDLLPGLLGVSFKGKNLIEGEPVVAAVRFGSPAEQVGLKAGDKLIAADGQPVVRMAELKQILGDRYAGDAIRLSIQRGDQMLSFDLTLAGVLPPYTPPVLGLQLNRFPEGDVPTIREVWENSPAAQAGLQPQDVIEQVNGTPTPDRAVLVEQLRRLQPGKEVQLQIRRGTESRPVAVVLGNPPTQVPAEVGSQAPFGQTTRAKEIEVGRIATTLPGHDRELWMYVPESYRTDWPQSLVIFLHPALNNQERDVLAAWRAECERRGIILLAPQATPGSNWSPNDLEYLKDCYAHVDGKYNIAPDRVVVLGMGNAAPIAALWAFREADMVRGLALIDAPALGQIPDNAPERRLSLYSLVRGTGIDAAKWGTAATDLRKAGYPLVLGTGSGEAGVYPSAEENAELARWVELLDEI